MASNTSDERVQCLCLWYFLIGDDSGEIQKAYFENEEKLAAFKATHQDSIEIFSDGTAFVNKGDVYFEG